jgi:hypothetical protein
MAPVEIKHEPGYILPFSLIILFVSPFRDETDLPIRLMPLALAGSRLAATAYASYTVGRSLYQSHKALGPAQDTRHRQAERTKLTIAFASLAALGLVFAVTSSWDYLSLSYKVWASERGIEVPHS